MAWSDDVMGYVAENYIPTSGHLGTVKLSYTVRLHTSDVGEIVYNLIRVDLMRKSASDRREDFDDVFDFKQAFDDDFDFAAGSSAS